MKDSFILYTKYIKQIKNLTMEQRGLLFTAILIHEAHGDDVMPELDAVTSMAFDFIREDLEENARKYLDKCITNAQNGSKGGRPKKDKPNKTEKTERFFEKRTETKKADNDSDSDNDNDLKEKDILTDIEKEKPAKEPLMPAAREIIGYLNEKAGTKYSAASKNTVGYISARMREGHTVEDFKTVIDKKVDEWKGDPEMENYLRPKTLFAPSHFDDYLNQKGGRKKPPDKVTQINRYDRNIISRTGTDREKNDDLTQRLINMQMAGGA